MAEPAVEQPQPDEPSLHDIVVQAFKKLNYPSADKLHAWLTQHGHVVSKAQIQRFTAKQPVRQIFHESREAPKSKQGKIVALSLHERWMADLIDLTAQPSGSEKNASGSKDIPQQAFRYILVVQNVFSRELYVKPLKSKDPETVTQAFKTILDANFAPGRLDTDNGAEFQGPFNDLLEKEGIVHILKDIHDHNALGTLDRAIQLFKQALFRRMAAEHTSDWKSLLEATVDGMNETVHSSLHGRVPEQVEVDDVLQFHLRKEAGEALLRNHEIIEARSQKLRKEGAFRTADARRTFQRSFHPRFGDKMHLVSHFDNGNVIDKEGNHFATKRVLAVPDTSNRTAPGAIRGLRGGSLLTENLRKAALKPYAHQLEEYLSLDTLSLANVVNKMKELGMAKVMVRGLNYKLALELLGFTVQKGTTGKFTVTGKRLRTPASQIQRRSIMPQNAAAATDGAAPNIEHPIRPRRRAFLEAQRFLHANARDLM